MEALSRPIRAHPGLTLVTLGPLTNVALALMRAPDLAAKVGRCVVMGGAACAVGNVTPAAEYNIWCDPEAARICFRSGMPIEMVGWELCRGAGRAGRGRHRPLPRPRHARARAIRLDCKASPSRPTADSSARTASACPTRWPWRWPWSPASRPGKSRHAVDVECEGALTRGMTVVDQLDIVPRGLRACGVAGRGARREPHVSVTWEIDVARFKAILFAALADPDPGRTHR